MRQATVIAAISTIVFITLGAAKVSTYRCGTCGKVEQYEGTSSRYCSGTTDKPHTKRLMDRTDTQSKTTSTYTCGTCGKVEKYEGTSNRYCTGSTDKPHTKRLMDRKTD